MNALEIQLGGMVLFAIIGVVGISVAWRPRDLRAELESVRPTQPTLREPK